MVRNHGPCPSFSTSTFVQNHEAATKTDISPEVLRFAQDDRFGSAYCHLSLRRDAALPYESRTAEWGICFFVCGHDKPRTADPPREKARARDDSVFLSWHFAHGSKAP
jgi:hypothetical protein